MKKIIIPFMILLFYLPVLAYGSDERRLLTGGNVLHVGQCYENSLCVVKEKTSYTWDGKAFFIYQWLMDEQKINCFYVGFKPIEDPAYGTFWVLFELKNCDVGI